MHNIERCNFFPWELTSLVATYISFRWAKPDTHINLTNLGWAGKTTEGDTEQEHLTFSKRKFLIPK